MPDKRKYETPMESDSGHSAHSSGTYISQKPMSLYEGYEKLKKGKTERKLIRKATKVMKVSILEANADAIIKPGESAFSSECDISMKTQEVPAKSEKFQF